MVTVDYFSSFFEIDGLYIQETEGRHSTIICGIRNEITNKWNNLE